MKKIHSFVSILLLLTIFSKSSAQDCVIDPLPPASASVTYESKNGYFLPCSLTIRILVVLAEIDWDVTSDPNALVTWQQGTPPSWINNFVDVNTSNTGLFTQYFNQASSGNYLVLGDFLNSPTNGGIITVKESDIATSNYKTALVAAINAQMTNGFATLSGLTNSSLFDLWQPGAGTIGLPKLSGEVVGLNWTDFFQI